MEQIDPNGWWPSNQQMFSSGVIIAMAHGAAAQNFKCVPTLNFFVYVIQISSNLVLLHVYSFSEDIWLEIENIVYTSHITLNWNPM